jgi:hypothetical protein
MLNFLKERRLRRDIQSTLDQIAVPEKLNQFVKQLPSHFENDHSVVINRVKKGKISPFKKVALICSLIVVFFVGAVNYSTAFAQFMKNFPGLSSVLEWLEQRREVDGVQTAVEHNYIPIEPVVVEQDGITVTISDIYLSHNHFSYKAFIKTDKLKDFVFKRDDGSLDFDHRKLGIFVHPGVTFPLAGSGGVIESNDPSKEPILVYFAESVGDIESEVENLLNQDPKELLFEVSIRNFSNKEVTTFPIRVPFDKKNLVPDKVIDLNQEIAIDHDPDYQKLILDKMIITPTKILLDITNPKPENELYFFSSRKEEDPVITDDQGKKYEYFHMNKLGDDPNDNSKYRVVFSSSPYFDESVKNLKLNLNQIEVTGKPEFAFEVSLNEEFPKKVTFKNREYMIHEAKYDNGFLFLKMAKDQFQLDRINTIGFLIKEYWEQLSNDRELAQFYDKNPIKQGIKVVSNGGEEFMEVTIAAPPDQETYKISMFRNADPVKIKESVDISLR